MSNPLNDLITNVDYRRYPAIYTEELIRLVAGYYDKELTNLGAEDANVNRMIKVANTLSPMRNNDAQRHWDVYRSGEVWYKRMTMPKKAPEWYVDNFLDIYKERARKDYDEAVAKMEGVY